jgi:cytidylate kinase
MTGELPKLITFDGEARSGKGTIVQATKDYLRDECGYKVMLIDGGQVFRVLVVAAAQAGIDLNDSIALDRFLADPIEIEKCVQLVKAVYHMQKDERDALLYTNEVGANSAVVGARPLSQEFKDELLKKWLHDARIEGYEVVLLDGRTLEQAGRMLEAEKLCDFVLGLYFICDPVVGARRTLGFANRPYDELDESERQSVDELVVQINERNRKDKERVTQPIAPPVGAKTYVLPDSPTVDLDDKKRQMVIFDTSSELSREVMPRSVALLAARILTK